MMFFKEISLLCFFCASSFLLGAQKTYLWNSAGERNYLSPSYYEMYEFDIQTGDRQLLFRLDSIRFVHPNMTGNSFQIISFAFSTDRKTIYFLEQEGDVYSYVLSNNMIKYHLDVTPGNDNFLWHGYHRTHQIDQLNDSLYYIGGQTKGILNVNNFQFTLIREIPSWAAGFTDVELKMMVRKLEKYKDKYIMLDGNVYLAYADLYDPVNNTIAVNQDLTPLDYFDDTNLLSYQYACDSTVLYTLQNKFYMGQRDTIQIDRVDLVTGEITRWKNYIGLTSDNFSTNRIRDIQHFNAPNWESCQRYIDLDKDDNTALNRNFIIDSLCTFTNIPLSDIDIHINNEYPVDSIDIFILDPRFSQYMYFPNGNYILKSTPNYWQRIVNNGTTSISDFESGIRNAYLDIENDPSATEVKIGFQVWYKGIVGDTAIATIKIVGPLPYAGQDNKVSYCENETSLDISQISSVDADKNGMFFNTNFDNIDKIPHIAPEDSTFIYYITTNGICFDTANIQIKINPIPILLPVNDTTTCHNQKISIQLASTIDSILWFDGSLSVNKEINTSGTYHYTIKNEYGCTVSDTFIYTQLPAPMAQNTKVQICKDSVFMYQGIPIISEGIYSDTLRNRLSCDSIISTLDLQYFDEEPLNIIGDTVICEGEQTELTVTSAHIQILWNTNTSGKTFKVSEGGLISLSAIDNNGCSTETELEVIEYLKPKVFTIDMLDTIYTEGLELNVEYNDPNLTYIWTPSTNLSCNDCAYPVVLQKENNAYIIEVINEYGCRDTALIRLSFKKSNLYLPNILSKNSITNNTFYAQGSTNERYTIEIFDRWGNKVFGKENAEVGNVQDGWQVNESLSQGVYVYVITYFDKGENKVIFGDITLIE
ncbi:MAG TPA: gliding motility-associated C-terminal domain-containing protein [Saprospiraceae bacterium]|jgi:hypothetical protein|nr:gliding motility-associated C-terminal domain-containing protein [Saprospiraceae bacterium]